jgi:Fe-S-cluster containining protein
MTDPRRLKMLQEIYRIHEAFLGEFDTVCRKACAHCCTQNVTSTSLEVRLILNHWETVSQPDGLGLVQTIGDSPRFQPRMTLNQLADRCAKGMDIPEESTDPAADACPFLRENVCRIYEVRPFGCRAMVSQTDCADTGEARMPDYVLTVNNVFLQNIEALDESGVQGNLIDVLLFSASRRTSTPEPRVIRNHPLSVLMVPPEHRHRIRLLLDALSRASAGIS